MHRDALITRIICRDQREDVGAYTSYCGLLVMFEPTTEEKEPTIILELEVQNCAL